MKCPKCGKAAGLNIQNVEREEGQPYMYAVLCDMCDEPLHFAIDDNHFIAMQNLHLGFEAIALALNNVADALKDQKN